jgi:hypothetical protein
LQNFDENDQKKVPKATKKLADFSGKKKIAN